MTSKGDGRWLIYAADPMTSAFGGLDSGNPAVWNATYGSLPPNAVTAEGHRYLFALTPTITFTTIGITKMYGDDVTVKTLPHSYVESGEHRGVLGAHAPDPAGVAYE